MEGIKDWILVDIPSRQSFPSLDLQKPWQTYFQQWCYWQHEHHWLPLVSFQWNWQYREDCLNNIYGTLGDCQPVRTRRTLTEKESNISPVEYKTSFHWRPRNHDSGLWELASFSQIESWRNFTMNCETANHWTSITNQSTNSICKDSVNEHHACKGDADEDQVLQVKVEHLFVSWMFSEVYWWTFLSRAPL